MVRDSLELPQSCHALNDQLHPCHYSTRKGWIEDRVYDDLLPWIHPQMIAFDSVADLLACLDEVKHAKSTTVSVLMRSIVLLTPC